MKDAARRKRDERERMRERGYVLRQIWTHPDDMASEPDQLEAIGLLRECLTAINATPNFRYGDRRMSYQLAARIGRFLDRAAEGT